MKLRALGAIVAAVALLAVTGWTWQNAGTLVNQGDAVALRCDQNQGRAILEVPATSIPGPTPTPVATGTPTAGPTSTPHAFAGQITVYTATNRAGESPGPFGSPYNSVPANSTSYTVAVSSYPVKLYIDMHGDQWVEAVLTSPDPSGASDVPTVTCALAQ